MKKLIIILALLSGQYLFANMASPIIPGTMVATPFTSQYIDILGEKIFIRINKSFTTAKFQIEYRVKSSAIGKQIPLIFYAANYNKDFKIWIDGKEISIKKLPDELQLKDSILLADFHHLFNDENTLSDSIELSLSQSIGYGIYVEIHDLLFFEADITEGEHVIKVEYEAVSEIDGSGWVNNYSFRYSLSPAKYWKSFNRLEIKIDATEFKNNITCNLDKSNSGSIDSIANWSFLQLPGDFIVIEYNPQISSFAQTLIDISPEGIAIILGLLFIIVHITIIINHRNRNMKARFSKIVIIGSILVPLLYVIINYYAYYFIDNFIEEASGNHGYIFLIFFLYPILLPFYWLTMWLVDRIYKRNRLRMKNTTY